MKRGFLNRPKAEPRPTEEACLARPTGESRPMGEPGDVYTDPQTGRINIHFPIGKVPKVELPDKFSTKYVERDPLSTSAPGAITITTIPNGVPNEPESECIFFGGSKEVVMAIPNFPRPMRHPKTVAFRMGHAPGKGMGLFSTRALRVGNLILTERPLLVCARNIADKAPGHYSPEMMIQYVLDETERTYEIAYNRMSAADKEAFMALANCHLEDGSGPLTGRVRTNGLGVSGLRPGVEGDLAYYSAICKHISRLNHSCSPNTYPAFDIPSFSFSLYAVRDIAEGEELTFQYMDVLTSAAERQKSLRRYDLVCTCPACTDPAASDPRRAAIRAYTPNTLMWAADSKFSDDFLINNCLEQLELLTKEGLEHCYKYFEVTVALMHAYICLGDAENASKWAAIVVKQVWRDDEEDRKNAKALVDPNNVAAYKAHTFWRSRVNPAADNPIKMVQKLLAMAGPDNIKTLDNGSSLIMFPGPGM
ncbi:ER lumen protein-retaining receptor [Favolaschia claudopus]|uniref:ER lumen protein-retaining receptor n=1 Tax=Favolaschia claudopus TaxID=2862362 RepID=A0AAW0EAD9_9AGAR